MTDVSPVLDLPFIMPSQAQKHVTHNEALRRLDVLVQAVVIDRDRSAPPARRSLGDRHIVGAGATAAWAGRAGEIALFDSDGWQFTAPRAGWRVHVLAEGETLTHDGSAWRAPRKARWRARNWAWAARHRTDQPPGRRRARGAAEPCRRGPPAEDQQGRAGRYRQPSVSDRVFRPGRDGAAGGDDFEVKVSDDGAIFRQAVVAEASTGLARFPQGARTAALEVEGDSLRVTQPRTPGSASDSGAAGQIAWDADYVYVCVATDTWKRAALSSW